MKTFELKDERRRLLIKNIFYSGIILLAVFILQDSFIRHSYKQFARGCYASAILICEETEACTIKLDEKIVKLCKQGHK